MFVRVRVGMCVRMLYILPGRGGGGGGGGGGAAAIRLVKRAALLHVNPTAYRPSRTVLEPASPTHQNGMAWERRFDRRVSMRFPANVLNFDETMGQTYFDMNDLQASRHPPTPLLIVCAYCTFAAVSFQDL